MINAQNFFLLVKKSKKYRKCPALRFAAVHRSWPEAEVSQPRIDFEFPPMAFTSRGREHGRLASRKSVQGVHCTLCSFLEGKKENSSCTAHYTAVYPGRWVFNN